MTSSTEVSIHGAAPQQIGKYQIIERAGQGSMGVVYRALDPYQDREVAIKMCTIVGDARTDPTVALFRRMFFNEAQTAGSLQHENILEVLDAGEEEGQPYIVMEYIANAETLEQYCHVDNMLPVESVIEIGYRCAKALDYAHRRGVVHRDIKPTNILLTASGQIKIGDFGIAQRLQSEATHVLGVVGSPRYMSPEQAREEAVSSQSDLYSLGVVLYELLTGKPLFTAQHLAGLVQCILNDTPNPVQAFRPEVGKQFNTIVMRCLAKDPHHRYQSGMQVAAELSLFLEEVDAPIAFADNEKFDMVRGLSFFNEFSDPEIWEVLRTCQWENHTAGESVVKEGDIDNALYIIATGSVSVTKDHVRLTRLAPGECFGEMGYLINTHRTASVVANQDVSLIKISALLIERASIPCQLRFNQEFLRVLATRLARTSESLTRHVLS
ncbi:MAG: protein kinase [Gammaproteobacteria bacterium]|nr:protein kinase [Gammaproteobacteria bacterium]